MQLWHVAQPHGATVCGSTSMLRGRPLRSPTTAPGSLRPRAPLRVSATAEPVERKKKADAPATPPTPGGGGGGGGPPPDPQPKQPFVLKVLDQAYDTAEDVGRHLYRAVLPLPTRTALDEMAAGRGGRTKLVKGQGKPVLLVLGSGWGAHSLIKVIDTEAYDVVLVSPRNYFFFTPILPSSAVGTVEFRSLTDPIRSANPFVNYLDSTCEKIDLQRKVATCISDVALENVAPQTFEVEYDMLVVAVGEQPASFGVPGVREHCFFMKEITDAQELRKRIGSNFEYAGLPSTSEDDRKRALHFVVVGGGPTGVEFSGTLADFVTQDLKRKYPELMPLVRVTLLQSAQSILTMFQGKLQDDALKQLQSQGVDVRLGVKVVEVTDRAVKLANGEVIETGCIIWSAGNSSRPLTRDLVEAIPQQREANAGARAQMHKLQVDPYLRVIGAKDVIAIGDCSAMALGRLPATAQVAAQQASFVAHMINRGYSLGEGGLDALPPAKKQRGGLQAMFAGSGAKSVNKPVYYKRTFNFLDLGMMAYVGGDTAATQLKIDEAEAAVFGSAAFFIWRSVYITKQVSLRNRVLILFDWIKTKVFGRDLSLF